MSARWSTDIPKWRACGTIPSILSSSRLTLPNDTSPSHQATFPASVPLTEGSAVALRLSLAPAVLPSPSDIETRSSACDADDKDLVCIGVSNRNDLGFCDLTYERKPVWDIPSLAPSAPVVGDRGLCTSAGGSGGLFLTEDTERSAEKTAGLVQNPLLQNYGCPAVDTSVGTSQTAHVLPHSLTYPTLRLSLACNRRIPALSSRHADCVTVSTVNVNTPSTIIRLIARPPSTTCISASSVNATSFIRPTAVLVPSVHNSRRIMSEKIDGAHGNGMSSPMEVAYKKYCSIPGMTSTPIQLSMDENRSVGTPTQSYMNGTATASIHTQDCMGVIGMASLPTQVFMNGLASSRNALSTDSSIPQTVDMSTHDSTNLTVPADAPTQVSGTVTQDYVGRTETVTGPLEESTLQPVAVGGPNEEAVASTTLVDAPTTMERSNHDSTIGMVNATESNETADIPNNNSIEQVEKVDARKSSDTSYISNDETVEQTEKECTSISGDNTVELTSAGKTAITDQKKSTSQRRISCDVINGRFMCKSCGFSTLHIESMRDHMSVEIHGRRKCVGESCTRCTLLRHLMSMLRKKALCRDEDSQQATLHPVLPAAEVNTCEASSADACVDTQATLHPVLPATEVNTCEASSADACVDTQATLHPVLPAAEVNTCEASAADACVDTQATLHPVLPAAEVNTCEASSADACVDTQATLHPVLPAAEVNTCEASSADACVDTQATLHPVLPAAAVNTCEASSADACVDTQTTLHPVLPAAAVNTCEASAADACVDPQNTTSALSPTEEGIAGNTTTASIPSSARGAIDVTSAAAPSDKLTNTAEVTIADNERNVASGDRADESTGDTRFTEGRQRLASLKAKASMKQLLASENDDFDSPVKQKVAPVRCARARGIITDAVTAHTVPSDTHSNSIIPSSIVNGMPPVVKPADKDGGAAILNNEDFYRCGFPDCAFTCDKKHKFLTHMAAQHRFSFAYPCHYCSCLWETVERVTLHLETHRKGMHYRCIHCDISFENRTDATQHIDDSHLGNTRFFCNHCDFSSVMYTNFKVHYFSVHAASVQPHACFGCGFVAKDLANMFSHIEQRISYSFQCKHCVMQSRLKHQFHRHMQIVHPSLKRGEFVLQMSFSCCSKKATPAVTTAAVTTAVTTAVTQAVTSAVIPAVTPAVTPVVTPAVTPVVTPAVTPAVTVTTAVTPAVTQAVTSIMTPLVTPAVRPAVTMAVTAVTMTMIDRFHCDLCMFVCNDRDKFQRHNLEHQVTPVKAAAEQSQGTDARQTLAESSASTADLSEVNKDEDDGGDDCIGDDDDYIGNDDNDDGVHSPQTRKKTTASSSSFEERPSAFQLIVKLSSPVSSKSCPASAVENASTVKSSPSSTSLSESVGSPNSWHTLFSCPYCDFSVVRRLALMMEHILVEHLKRQRFWCVWCGYEHMRRDYVLGHLKTSHPDRLSIVYEDLTFLGNMKCSKPSIDGDKLLVCVISDTGEPVTSLSTGDVVSGETIGQPRQVLDQPAVDVLFRDVRPAVGSRRHLYQRAAAVTATATDKTEREGGRITRSNASPLKKNLAVDLANVKVVQLRCSRSIGVIKLLKKEQVIDLGNIKVEQLRSASTSHQSTEAVKSPGGKRMKPQIGPAFKKFGRLDPHRKTNSKAVAVGNVPEKVNSKAVAVGNVPKKANSKAVTVGNVPEKANSKAVAVGNVPKKANSKAVAVGKRPKALIGPAFKKFASAAAVGKKSSKVLDVEVDEATCFVCSECGECVCGRSRMYEHLIQELDYKPYACGHCSRRTSLLTQMKKHAQLAHRGRPFKMSKVPDEAVEAQLETLLQKSAEPPSGTSLNSPRRADLPEKRAAVTSRSRAGVSSPTSSSSEPISRPAIKSPPAASPGASAERRISPFCCGFCSFTTFVSVEIQSHMAQHMARLSRPFECGYCDFVGQTRAAVVTHSADDHPCWPLSIMDNVQAEVRNTPETTPAVQRHPATHAHTLSRVAPPTSRQAVYRCHNCQYETTQRAHALDHCRAGHQHQDIAIVIEDYYMSRELAASGEESGVAFCSLRYKCAWCNKVASVPDRVLAHARREHGAARIIEKRRWHRARGDAATPDFHVSLVLRDVATLPRRTRFLLLRKHGVRRAPV